MEVFHLTNLLGVQKMVEHSIYMQSAVLIFKIGGPLIIITIVSAYALMFDFLERNKIKINDIGAWALLSGCHFYFEIPCKYSDLYNEKHGKMGPHLKLLWFGIFLLFSAWVSVVVLIIFHFANYGIYPTN